jgi:hypothetical protein
MTQRGFRRRPRKGTTRPRHGRVDYGTWASAAAEYRLKSGAAPRWGDSRERYVLTAQPLKGYQHRWRQDPYSDLAACRMGVTGIEPVTSRV